MIIAPNLKLNVYEEDDKVIVQQVSDNTLVAEQAKFMRENTDRGFSADRQYQLVGYMPMEIFQREGFASRPTEELFAYMESEEMATYRVSRKNTGHSGRIIIK